jgi:hypothetical protein
MEIGRDSSLVEARSLHAVLAVQNAELAVKTAAAADN